MSVKKVLVYLYKKDEKVKKMKLEEGEYTLGSDDNESQIVIDDE